ncbi:Trp biosynthesis-associated membrane protein [Agromyces sp. NPDC058136]|uniref:Trp biosynthesis-associated membrane protein n=1 Tax=Agromyces sp. NPDC058136 TaxID=3346354 RepID=UPI0036DD4DA6
MSAARMKLPVIVVTILGAGLGLLAWSQTWFDLVLAAGAGAHVTAEVIAVPGSVASPAIAALSLAGLALAAALSLAGPGIRLVLGVLEVLLGGCLVLAAALSLGDPVGSVSPAVTEATGVAGQAPTAELVGAAAATIWPIVAIVGGVLVVVAGVLVLVTGTRWPASTRRYRSGLEPVDGDTAPTGGASPAAERAASDRAIDDWDELSRGDDPTDDTNDPEPNR